MNDYLTTKELAELLRLKERKVYDLAASGKIPCSRATGKLLFPRRDIESWIKDHASGTDSASRVRRAKVLLGSHDPLLEWAIRESRCGLASYLDSSLDGLDRFANNEGIASGLHVYDAESDEWNRPVIEARFGRRAVVLVSWATRQRGLMVARDGISRIRGLNDLPGHTFVPRQPEAGSQVLLDTLLNRENIDTDGIDWLTPARSETDAALAVQEGKADAAFGLASLATQFSLGFIPIIEERFDLLVDRRAWFEAEWQLLLQFCRSSDFRKRAEELPGYRIDSLFEVRYVGD